jgi:hypothetical protein
MRTPLHVFYGIHRIFLCDDELWTAQAAGRKAVVRGTRHTAPDRPIPRTQVDGGVGRRRDLISSCYSDAQFKTGILVPYVMRVQRIRSCTPPDSAINVIHYGYEVTRRKHLRWSTPMNKGIRAGAQRDRPPAPRPVNRAAVGGSALRRPWRDPGPTAPGEGCRIAASGMEAGWRRKRSVSVHNSPAPVGETPVSSIQVEFHVTDFGGLGGVRWLG